MLQKSPETAPSAVVDVAAVLNPGSRRQLPRRLIIGAVVALIAAGGFWYWSSSSASNKAVTYTTAPVTRGNLTVTVTATGTVEPTDEVSVSSELSGTVRTVLVDYNDAVKAGQVLARLDTDKLTANVSLAKATVAAREADVRQAEVTVAENGAAYRRAVALESKGASTTQSVETARAVSDRANAALLSARATLDIANANLAIAQTDLAKADIRSPIDGVVLARAVEPGQIVASSLSAPVLFTLAQDLGHMELQVDIDEADMGKVKVGHTATFTVEAFPGRAFPAVITSIRFSPATVEGVVTYKAILTVDNSALLLRPGMTATADITVEQVKDALLVPNAALRYTPPVQRTTSGGSGLLGLILPRPQGSSQSSASTTGKAGERRIWVLRDGAPVAVAVTAGSSDGTRTAVSGEGLSEKDVVILGSRIAS